eukprot:7298695-Pyramimonas_sp.AAC.1
MGTRWTRRSSWSGTRTCSSKSASWRGRRSSSQSPRSTSPATATVSTLAVTPSVVVDAPEYSPLIWVSTLAVTPSVVVDAPKYSPSCKRELSVLRLFPLRLRIAQRFSAFGRCAAFFSASAKNTRNVRGGSGVL